MAKDLSSDPPIFQLPDEIWMSMLSTPCTFGPELFSIVMINLIKNPNIMSSHLFRADIFYDSLNDTSVSQDYESKHFSNFTKHLKVECRPLRIKAPGYTRQRTFVRQMVPRNPQLDRALLQTCHFYHSEEPGTENNVVIYLPHVRTANELPWYHPAVRALAFVHTWQVSEACHSDTTPRGTLSIHLALFDGTEIEPRLQRTTLNLLRITHKHGQGQLAGYTKRVNHDLVVPQAMFQNTYSRLKTKHAKALIGEWVEQTDPEKHVFEDLGIAAFLIELWAEMYSFASPTADGEEGETGEAPKPVFPGFVDIGCGNGVLVYVLLQEGYSGWGFDARRRKTWGIFPANVQDRLKEMVLVPRVLQDDTADVVHTAPTSPAFHDGVFGRGTFIISNHADELTLWTPLLAHLSDCPFIAIPCCSHNLAGARFRAPAPSSRKSGAGSSPNSDSDSADKNTDAKGDLKRPAIKQPSAYASLCAYVSTLTESVGYIPEREMLRIPSTRNMAVIGRRVRDHDPKTTDGSATSAEQKMQKVKDVLERETRLGLDVVGREWVDRARKIAGKKSDGHW
ncbi:hypothetical protein BJ546DRAFT_837916 [Cryomyces antarcticus]